MPTVLNAANEVAVAAFRGGRLSFTGISDTVARVMAGHTPLPQGELAAIMEADRWARREAEAFVCHG